MGWQDRPYYRDSEPSGASRLMWLLTGSVPLFTAFGIRVRMHVSLLVLIVVELALAETRAGLGARNAATAMSFLFGSVLLHEFGHCFGSRWVGGEADEILMWPLGGLAMISPPHRPWAQFISTAAGPAVNLVICLITGLVVFLLDGAIPWFPLRAAHFNDYLYNYIPHGTVAYYCWWLFLVNYGLLMFNLLLVFYPFDGGRMIQELLWLKIGYYRSMMIATSIGMVGAVAVAGFGLISSTWMLVWIAGFGFYYSYRQRQQLREMGPEEYADETDYSAAYEPATPRRKRSRSNQRFIKKARKRAAEARLEQERIDQILAKVSAQGMASLTWSERRALRKATEHRRKRDLELSQ